MHYERLKAVSIPSNVDKTPESDLQKRKVLIMRVQLALNMLGYYNHRINGTLDQNTRDSIVKYRYDFGRGTSPTIDKGLLNSLGIPTQ